MNFLFLMDPLSGVKMKKDTSFILMLCAAQRGHKVFYLPDGGIVLKNNTVSFHAVPVTPQLVEDAPFIEGAGCEMNADDVDAVFIRTDPPFDQQYLINTWLLDRLPPSVAVINKPSGVRAANEKIWATQFSSLVPPTLVGRRKDDIMQFLREHKEIIVKPTGGFGGSSVFHIRQGDLNTNVILETITATWTKEVIVQKYIAEAKNGDKRIIVLDGKPLGAVLRMHAEDDHRNNFFSGGKPVSCEMTARDRAIVAALAPELKRLGLYFVGIDILGEYLIEINVTSPTCVQEINRLHNVALENEVIDFAEALVQRSKKT